MCKHTRAGTSARAFSLTSLLLAGLIAGCESDATGPGGEFDEEAAAADVAAVLNAADDDIVVTLLLAAEGLASAGGSASMMPALAAPSSGSGGFGTLGAFGSARLEAAASRLLPSLSPATLSLAAEPILPSNLLGVTFVWDGTGYVPDEAREGAPANGVRFVVYAIHPITRQPAEPLVEVGHLDLTDEGTASSTRLGIRLVDSSGAEDVELVDYFIDVSFTVTETTSTVVLAALGFVSDGSETLDFDLDQTLSFAEAGGGSLSVDYDFAIEGSGLALSFVALATFDAETEESAGVSVTLTLSQGANAVVLSATESAAGALDGEITFNGETAILVTGTAASPQFTRPDGSELTAAEVQALVDIVDAVTEVLIFAEELFAPITGVLAA